MLTGEITSSPEVSNQPFPQQPLLLPDGGVELCFGAEPWPAELATSS